MTDTINRRRFPILLVTPLALLAILGAIAGAPLLPATAQAQANVLVTNLEETSAGGGSRLGPFDHAQGFRTGANAAGYVLTSIEVKIETPPPAGKRVTAEVWTSSGGVPSARHATLIRPASIVAGNNTFWARAGTTLAGATTNYFVVLESNDNTDTVELSVTASEDQGPDMTDWRIADSRLAKNDNSTDWTALNASGQVAQIRINGFTTESAPPQVTDAEVSTDGRNIVLTFSEDLDHPTSYSSTARNAFTVTVDGVDNQVSGLNGFEDTVTLTMARLMGGNQKVVVGYDRSAAGSQTLEDSDNQEVLDFATGSDGVPAVDNKSTVDTTPPALTAATVSTNGNNVTLTFDENVVPAVGTLPSALADAFTVTVDGVGRGVTRVFSLARTQVTLSVASTIHQGQTVTVSYDASAAGTNALQDDADNDVASFTTGENSVPDVTNNSTVASAKLVSVTVPANGQSFTLTFDKALNSASTGLADQFTATADGVEVSISGSSGLGSADDNFTLLVSTSAPIYKDEEVVVTYEKPTGSDGLTDEANDLSVVSFTTGQYGVPGVTNNSTVVVPPRLADAEVQTGGNEIYLGFGLALDVPATVAQALKDAFTVTVDGEERAFADLEFFGLGDTFVKLVFTETLIPAGAAVVVSYDQSDAGTSALEGTLSNKVPDFTTGAGGVVAVTNNSTVSSDATLSGLTVSIKNAAGNALETVTLSPSFDSAIEAYSVSVAFHRGQVTFMPDANQTGATVDYFDATDMALEDAGTSSAAVDAGHQVATALGANTVKVKVTAPDKTTTKTYTVTVTRKLPTLHGAGVQANGTSLLLEFQAAFPSGTGSLPAGAVAAFTVTADGVEREITGIVREVTDAILNVTLSTAIYKDQAVVVSYDSAAADGDAIEDENGNAFQSFTSGQDGVAEAANNSTQSFPTPSAPTNFTATEGNRRVTLAWTAPAETAPVTKHQYRHKTTGEYDDADWEDIPDSGPGGDNEDGYTVTGLDNGTAYTFQLRAANRQNQSTAVESDAVTPADVTAPTLRRAEVKLGSSGSIDLEFSENLDLSRTLPASIVAAFTVTVDAVELDVSLIQSADKRLIIHAGTTIYQGQAVVVSYDKSVAGSNAIADDADNEVASFTTGEDGVPAVRNNSGVSANQPHAPPNFTATAGSGQVTLAWTAPATGGPITRYEYAYRTDGAIGDWFRIPDSGAGGGNEEGFTVTGLDNGTAYTFQLRAVGPGGNSTVVESDAATPMSAGASSDATLRALAVNDGTSDLTLTPAFAPGTTEYAVSAANDVARVTVAPTVNHAEAEVEYLDGDDNDLDDADTNAAGHQAALLVGANVVKVKVTAEDTTATETYTVTVTRAAAMTPGTCMLNPGDIWCGVLTVGAVSSNQDGFFGSTGGLTDTTFSVGSSNYMIEQLTVNNSTSTNAGDLLFGLDRDRMLSAANRARLVLHVDDSGDMFAFNATAASGFSHLWTGTDLDWSSATTVTLRLRLTPEVPGKPTNLMAEADGSTRIELSWEAPADDGGSAITGYRIEVSDDGSSNWRELEADTGDDDTSYIHTGLSPGDTQHYRVSAINAVGMSDASDSDSATTMREDPAADASLSALDVTRSGGVPVPLQPAFDSDETDYEASVANAVDEVTVAAETNAAGATLAYLDGDDNALDDADTGTPGREVALEVGEETLVQVKVTAANGDAMRTYRVTVTRRAVDAPGEEGEFRLNPNMEQPYEDPDNSRYAGKQSRLEVFHAGRWGTVCSDRFKGSDITSHPSHGNLAPELACQAMGYDDGEYASGFGRSGPHQPDESRDKYLKPGSSYPADGPLPIWLDDVMCWTRDGWPFGDDPTPDYGRLKYLENPEDPEDQTLTPYLCAYAGWGLHNGTHREDAGVRCWYDSEQSPQDSERALEGRFLSSPEQHDGSKRVTVEVAFSEPIDETPEGLRNHGVRVEGGEVTAVHREVGQPGTGTRSAGGPASGQVVWVIEIQPTSAEDLTLSLDGGRPCHEAGAICTADGRTLSEGISTTVKGPSSLTASFQDVPETHDGETPFTFRVAFSEDIDIGLPALREDAFTVTGGMVADGQRVDGRHDLFEVRVEPNSGGDVTITLPAGRDCSVSGAICTAGENQRLLSNSPTAKVAGPANTPATGAPTISGTAQVGQTLTADITGIADADGLSGETFAYQWVSSDGTTDTDIEKATGSTHKLTAADRGRSIKVRVTFTDGGGNEETLTSAPMEPVLGDGPPGAPRNLTANPGNREVTLSWDPPADNGNAPPTRYRIEWRVDGKDYDKNHWGTARSTTYTTNDQANLANGVKYVFQVKAENDDGYSYGPYGPASGEVSATPTSGSAVDLDTPVLSNTETLHHGMVRLDWQDIEDAGWYVVQHYHLEGGEWLDLPAEGVDIAFHGSSAVVSNLHGLSWLRVGAESCDGASEWSQIEELYGTKESDWEGVPVPEVAEGDQIEPCPVVLGTPVLSEPENLHHGMVQLDWQDIEDAGWYVVQYYHLEGGEWLDLPAEGVEIAFHGSSAVVSNLHGLSWLRVRAMSCAGASEWSQIEQLFGTNASDWEGVPVPEVAEGDEIEPCSEDADTPDNSPATGAPTISGTAQVGELLTANTSGVVDADGLGDVQYEYQWLADDSDTSGATNATYTLVAGDEGKAIKVRVSFTDDAGNEETLTSAATDAVAGAPTPNSPATGAPTISGTAQVGETLTANTSGIADADGLSDVQYEYQWLSDDSDIAGATGLTYTLVDVDEGKAIKVEVTFTDDTGNDETLTSAATAAAAAEPSEPPDKPRGLEATVSNGQVVLTWDDPEDDSITGYVILRRVRVNDQGGDFSVLVANTETAATTYTDDTVAASTTYTYRIKAINEHGVSERSRWVHIDTPAAPEPEEKESAEPPDKPTGLEAAASNGQVVLTWDDPEDDSITGYVILRRVRVNDQGGDFSVLVANTGSATTTYTDDEVEASNTYTYRIKAINEHGTSERSRWYHIDTPAAP